MQQMGLTVMQACAHRCVMQAEVFYHLVLVASADIVPEDTRGHTASVKLKTQHRSHATQIQNSDIRRSCMVSQTEPS